VQIKRIRNGDLPGTTEGSFFAMKMKLPFPVFLPRPATFCLLILIIGSISSSLMAETLTIGGTGSALGVMRKLGNAFSKGAADVQVDVLPSIGSAGAIKGLATKSIDVGVIARPLKDDESPLGLTARLVAKTPIVLATSRQGEAAVSTTRLVEIYSGKGARWVDGSPVRIVLRPTSEADTQLLSGLSPAMKKAIDDAITRDGMTLATTDQEAGDALQRLPGSLGTSTMALIRSEDRPLRMLSLDGVPPAIVGKVNPAYPLAKPLYIAVRDDAKPLVARFVRFVLSAEGKSILQNNGYSNVGD
jgi:phosphate transport system substrate-binding protein